MTSPQSADGQIVVVATSEGVMWQCCIGGICARAYSGAQLMEMVRALRISRGRLVPPG